MVKTVKFTSIRPSLDFLVNLLSRLVSSALLFLMLVHINPHHCCSQSRLPHHLTKLQWTGGRADGHHSYEDFHQPILATHHIFRQYDNISLIAGSGSALQMMYGIIRSLTRIAWTVTSVHFLLLTTVLSNSGRIPKFHPRKGQNLILFLWYHCQADFIRYS